MATICDEYRSLDDLHPHAKNYNVHNERQIERLADAVRLTAYTAPVICKPDGTVLGGHLRRLALLKLRADSYAEPEGIQPGWLVPCRVVECNEVDELRILATDNPDPAGVEFDNVALASILTELNADDALSGTWYDEARLEALIGELAAGAEGGSGGAGGGPSAGEAGRTLAERFGVPPFSVLDARQGYWQERKRAWIALGIQSELGRGESAGQKLTMSDTVHSLKPSADQARKRSHPIPGGGTGKNSAYLFRTQEGYRAIYKEEEGHGAAVEGHPALAVTCFDGGPMPDDVNVPASGTSIFDPVLCELAYRWFCPEAGAVLDPFAGGSVRGIVASRLGRSYTGIDLSGRQLEANEAQAAELYEANPPRWIEGDSTQLTDLAPGEYDFLFSCPPYADLEVYSDDPRDLSTMPYEDFLAAYREIIRQGVSLLKPDRFACFVVGDVRDPQGFYRSFVADTVRAFADAGAGLYNDAVLVTVCGSLPIRVGKQFGSYRKLGKTHQNVLVFFKGDPNRIPDLAGDCEFGDLGESEAED